MLLFEASVTSANRCAYDGVYRYAKAVHWNVHAVEYSLAADKRTHRSTVKGSSVVADMLTIMRRAVENGKRLEALIARAGVELIESLRRSDD